MSDENSQVGLSPTVKLVVDQFVARMRADDQIDRDAIDRLEKLLRQPLVPKADDVHSALFDASSHTEQ